MADSDERDRAGQMRIMRPEDPIKCLASLSSWRQCDGLTYVWGYIPSSDFLQDEML